jgi:hypothetical protein
VSREKVPVESAQEAKTTVVHSGRVYHLHPLVLARIGIAWGTGLALSAWVYGRLSLAFAARPNAASSTITYCMFFGFIGAIFQVWRWRRRTSLAIDAEGITYTVGEYAVTVAWDEIAGIVRQRSWRIWRRDTGVLLPEPVYGLPMEPLDAGGVQIEGQIIPLTSFDPGWNRHSIGESLRHYSPESLNDGG